MRASILVSAVLACVAGAAAAQTPARLRGVVVSLDAQTLRVHPDEGADEAVIVPDAARVTLVTPTTLAAIAPGRFIGTAARAQDDGTLVAAEVHVFPESMRGAGEGHRPFDLGPRSSMTNGTVGEEVVGKAGPTLTVRYKGGEQQIVVPDTTPIVAFAPGDRTALKVGAHVVVLGERPAGAPLTARALLVGKDGFVPPL